MTYVNLPERFFNPDGSRRVELDREDRLHLSREGYRVWAESIGPLVERLAGKD